MSIENCHLCPRNCGVSRADTYGDGYCGMPDRPMVARAALHFGEEPCITGKNGSGTIFFSGCSLGCLFCQNRVISREKYGKIITAEELAALFRRLEEQGAHNINLVSPTHFAHQIRKALLLYKPKIPVVYNSGGYEKTETLRSLEGLIDVYLPDCKYVHGELAAALSDAGNYFDYAAPALEEMIRQTGAVETDENGMIRRGTMVRHLVLPGHTKESMAVLDHLSRYKDKIWVSLMFQYTPMGELAAHPELRRPLTRRECDKVWDYMLSVGIVNGYVQDRAASGHAMIPDFDLTGV